MLKYKRKLALYRLPTLICNKYVIENTYAIFIAHTHSHTSSKYLFWIWLIWTTFRFTSFHFFSNRKVWLRVYVLGYSMPHCTAHLWHTMIPYGAVIGISLFKFHWNMNEALSPSLRVNNSATEKTQKIWHRLTKKALASEYVFLAWNMIKMTIIIQFWLGLIKIHFFLLYGTAFT